MPDKQPTFTVTFKELAVNAIKRQTRGHNILILNSTIDEITYKSLLEVNKEDFSESDYLTIELCFMGGPKKVTVLKKGELSDIQSKLDKYDNYTLCYPDAQKEDAIGLKNYIKAQREKNNYSIGIFANMDGLDSEYLINFVSNPITISNNNANVVVSAGQYTSRIAGALSGLSQNRSLTYFELDEIVDIELNKDPDSVAKNGGIAVIHQDGTYKLGRAVNSLTTLANGITEVFQKVRIINIMDMIANDIISTFRKNYVGKYTNNYVNKKRFVGAINTYLKSLASEGLLEESNQNEVYLSYEKIKNFIEAKGVSTGDMTREEILSYNTGSMVFLDGVCSPVDCMEDLNLGFYLFQALESEE